MKPVKTGLLGLGTVGGGVVTVLTRNAHEIARRAGREVVISHAAAKEYDAGAIHGLDQVGRITDDGFTVVNDPEVEIIIELIGGYSPAKEMVLQAIENKKHVVTANKAMIAVHGNEIFSAAQEQGVNCGVRSGGRGRDSRLSRLCAKDWLPTAFDWAAGIFNGTGNFILTEMRDKGRDFAEVLKEAQQLGYAEADSDV